MRIAVDAMGGDHAPAAVVEGAALCAQHADPSICLVGDVAAIEAELAKHRIPDGRVAIEAAREVIAMHETPSRAVRQKPNSSLAVAVRLAAEGQADAVVSAGNTGAFMALATMELHSIEGIERPAIAAVLPALTGQTVLIDAGANACCKPRMLAQFGVMGSIYAQRVLGVARPRVGLLNIGSEAVKGNETTKAAHALLSGLDLHFAGNVEGNDIFSGAVDVVVCDGFTGNVALKVAEGISSLLIEILRQELTSGARCRAGAWLAGPALARLRKRGDYAEYGGALLLGVNGVCIIGHGRSGPKAIMNAIDVARRSVDSGIVNAIRRSCESLAVA
jgi:glycerol-3-phosphate acyltransferase PlsX